MKSTISVIFLLFSIALHGIGHNVQGTDYSEQGVKAYAQNRHGEDGDLFLDPYFIPFLEKTDGQILLDAGCGAGPWAIIAAQNGAQVEGVDIQPGMIEHAKRYAQIENVAKSIHFKVGPIDALPYRSDYFDKAISINVGCNLPLSVFSKSFKELYRVLKPNGEVLITAPASFDTVFSTRDACDPVENIMRRLDKFPSINSSKIKELLSPLSTILRATFAMRDGRLILIDDEKRLVEGEPIWRKIPGLVVPNYYHSEKSYIDGLQKAGFVIDQIDRPYFQSLISWKKSSANLGCEYCHFYPFIILHASKPVYN